MVPTAVAMFYLGYKELKQKREEMEEQEKAEELERKRKAEDKYLNNDPDDMDDMLNREEDSYKSPYDSSDRKHHQRNRSGRSNRICFPSLPSLLSEG